MNVNNISNTEITTSTERIDSRSMVTITFQNENIYINASMACDNNYKTEDKTRRKILTYLGFSQHFIGSLYND
jgi:hypothetical protein